MSEEAFDIFDCSKMTTFDVGKKPSPPAQLASKCRPMTSVVERRMTPRPRQRLRFILKLIHLADVRNCHVNTEGELEVLREFLLCFSFAVNEKDVFRQCAGSFHECGEF